MDPITLASTAAMDLRRCCEKKLVRKGNCSILFIGWKAIRRLEVVR